MLHKNLFLVKKKLGDLFAEKETKRRPILAKGLLRRPRSPKGDLFGNTGGAMLHQLPRWNDLRDEIF